MKGTTMQFYTANTNGAGHVHPMLHEVFQKVFMKRPSLRYVATPDAVNSANEVYAFQIYDGVEFVGEIAWERYRPGRTTLDEEKIRYKISSPFICKERSPRNTLITTNTRSAVNTLLDDKAIRKREPSELIAKKIGEAKYMTDELVRKSRWGISARHSETDILKFILKVADGELPNLDDFPKIKASVTDDNRTAMANFEIATGIMEAVGKEQFYLVEYEIDESITAYSAITKEKIYQGNSTYELPSWVQSKLAMLKMIDKGQAIRNVGAKLDSERIVGPEVVYIVLDGEIPDLIE